MSACLKALSGVSDKRKARRKTIRKSGVRILKRKLEVLGGNFENCVGSYCEEDCESGKKRRDSGSDYEKDETVDEIFCHPRTTSPVSGDILISTRI